MESMKHLLVFTNQNHLENEEMLLKNLIKI